jgi:diguanylate cyclase (GGDEF)-like protein
VSSESPLQEAIRVQREKDSTAERAFASPRSPSLLRLVYLLAGLAAVAGVGCAYLREEYTLQFLISLSAISLLGMLGLVMAQVTRSKLIESQRRYQARLFIRNLELQDMAMRDDLTQLFNRRYFYERLQRELDQARSYQRPLAVVVLDVDGLKAVNDVYGHKAGDLVLATMGRLLVECTRTCDVPARIGGDEFGIIMPETDKSGAFAVARRLQQGVESASAIEENGRKHRLRVSMGVSGFPWGGDDVDQIVQWADTYMYAAKGARRDPASSSTRKGSGVQSPAPVRAEADKD